MLSQPMGPTAGDRCVPERILQIDRKKEKTMLWISDQWKDYEVLDTSDGERL